MEEKKCLFYMRNYARPCVMSYCCDSPDYIFFVLCYNVMTCIWLGSAPDIKKFEVPVKEWIIRRGTTKTQCEMVSAYPVDWKTPSIERMWLGTNVEDKTRRLRAFLTCMESDTPLMLNTQYVPQQLLLLCCVLRYANVC